MVASNDAVTSPLYRTSRNREERTVVFTDIVNSVGIKREIGEARALALFERHDAVVRGILTEYAGAKELGVAGDSFTLSFLNAADALVYSLRLHTALEPLAVEFEVSFQIRIGIHTGALLVDESAHSGRPIGGMVLDLCARVMSLADGGQTLLSRIAFDEARRALRHPQLSWLESLEWLSHGLYQMKGDDEPLEICEVGRPGQAPLKAPAHADKARRLSTPDGELVLGWRPAVGREVPGTSWRLERPLGEGGFGEVWLARHTVLKERRVFKFCFREDRVRSLKREVTLFRVLRENAGHHRHIVDVHDVYLNEPPYYVAMDFVEGNALPAWVESVGGFDRVPVETRVEIVAQVADALQAAHQAGVLHRDVKPGNILIAGKQIEDPQVKLSDFGIGQVLSLDVLGSVTAHGLTQTLLGSSSASGTQMYLAPEVVRGQPSSPQSDIFALGVVLFQSMVGDFSRPLTTDWEEMVDDPLIREDLRQCFAGDPAKRFASADRLAERLRALPDRREAAEARRAEVAAAERRAFRAGVVRTALGAAAIVILVAALALLAWGQANAARKHAAAEVKARGQADTLLERERMQRAEALLKDGKTPAALAYLAATVRKNPSQITAAERLVNTLLQRPLAWPETLPLPHQAYVDDLGVTKDGKSLLVVTNKATRLWDLAAGKERFPALPVGGRRLAFSPDGNRAVIAGDIAYLVDLTSFKIVYEFKIPLRGSKEGWRDAAFRPQGDIVAVLNASDELALWDTRSGFQVGETLRTGSSFVRVLFSPDGSRFAATDVEGRLWVWDFATREVRWKAKLPTRIEALAWQSSGAEIGAGGIDGTFRLFEAEGGDPIGAGIKPTQAITDINFSPDGREVCVTSEDSGIYFFSTETGKRRGEMYERYKVWQGQYTVDGSMIVVRTSEGLVKCFDAATRRPMLEPIECDAFPHTMRVSPDGDSVAIGGEDGRAQVWRIDARKAVPLRVNHRSTVRGAAFQSGSKQLVTAGTDGRVKLWDFAGASSSLLAQLPGPVTGIAATEGAIIVATEGDMRWLFTRKADGSWNEPKRLVPARAARFSRDGSHFVLVRVDGPAQLFATASGEPVSPPVGKSVFDAVVGRAGLDLIWIEAGEHIRRMDVKSGVISDTPISTKSDVSKLSVSPDGCWLGSISRDVAAVWCLDPGAAPPKYLPQGNVVTSLDFSEDDQWAIVTSFHRAAHLWKLPEGVRKPDSLTTGGELVRQARFLPADSRRAWTLDTQAVRYWDTSLSLPLSEPFLDREEAQGVFAASDGRRLAITRDSGPFVLVAETPKFPASAPAWIADWAESVGGFALGENGTPIPVSFAARNAWLEHAAQSAGTDLYSRALAWWLMPPKARPVSPFSDVPVDRESALTSRQYPARDPKATEAQIDLASLYSHLLDEPGDAGGAVGNTLGELLPGLYEWDGLSFDVRGVVQLGFESGGVPMYPPKIEKVKVAQKCRALHLIGAARNVNGVAGEEVLRLVVHYADGGTAEAPMRLGKDLGDWWPFVIAGDHMVWKGSNPYARSESREIGLYRMQWDNPRPDQPVATVDFVASNHGGAPFIVALTAQP